MYSSGNVHAFQDWEKYMQIVKQSSLWSLGSKISAAGQSKAVLM